MGSWRRVVGEGGTRGAVMLGMVGLWSFATAPALRGQHIDSETSAAQPSPTGSAVAAGDGLAALTVVGSIDVDGLLDEPQWSEADIASAFVQQVPQEGTPASEPTRVRILIDDDALYVGAWLGDAEPGEIVARLARRDEPVQADWFYVYLDSYHDRRTAFAFGVSAAGVQRDLRISGDRREDPSWDAVWASAVRLGSDGWTVELRIPLTQLRFTGAGPDARWGINFERRIARKNETAHWAPVPQDTDRFVSLFAELRGVGSLEPARRVEIVPYMVAQLTRAPGAADDPFHRPSEPFGAVGADVRVGLGSSLTLSATLNPDFGQVEADPATVNLTAFETFQDERRPFFVEGSDIFRLAFPFWPPFFYSRRIGRSPQGFGPPDAVFQDRPQATTILGAAKLSGKTDDGWSIGILDAVTGSEHARFVDDAGGSGSALVEPATNYAVVRVAKELRGGETGIGAMATAVNRGSAAAGSGFLHDQAYGLAFDGHHRLADGEYIANASVLLSHVRGSTDALQRTQRAAGHYFQRPDADHVRYDPSRRSLSGASVAARVQRARGAWKWGLWGEATTPGYEIADLGFNPSLDNAQTSVWLRHESFRPGSVFRTWSLGTSASTEYSWAGERKSLGNDLGFFFQLLNYWGGGVWIMRQHPAWSTTALRGGPALRGPGRWMGSLSVNSDARAGASGNAFVFWEIEDEAGSHQLNAMSSLDLRPSDRIDVGVRPALSVGRSAWQYVGSRELGGAPVWFVGDLARRTVSLGARLDYTVSPSASLQLYVRPFLASGRYRSVREVADPRADAFAERFRTYASGPEDGAFHIDRDGDGAADLRVNDPSFNVASLQLNAVFRWEYRPGSTLFAVWTHDRDASGGLEPDLRRDFERLMTEPARNVFMLKLSYWVGL